MMTRVRHKNRGLGQKVTRRETRIAYNLVAQFYFSTDINNWKETKISIHKATFLKCITFIKKS